MRGLIANVVVISALASASVAAPTRNGQVNGPAAAPKEHRNQVKPRQVATAPSQPNGANVWVERTRGPIVLDLPTGVAASGPPQASGQAYATSDLVGYNGQRQPASGNAAVPSPTLIPAQSASADEGLILDFQDVDQPQPIRGTDGKSGGTADEAVGT